MKRSSANLPSAAQRRRAIAFATAVVEHALAIQHDRDAVDRVLNLPVAPDQLPPRFCREFCAIVVFLQRLQASCLARNATPELPTVLEALKGLRDRLKSTPDAFWQEEDVQSDLHDCVWELHAEFDWQDWNNAPLATVGELDDTWLEYLADFLWDNRHLGEEAAAKLTDDVPATSPVHGSLLQRIRNPKGHRPQLLTVEVSAHGESFRLLLPQSNLKSARRIKKVCTQALAAAHRVGLARNVDIEDVVAAANKLLQQASLPE